VLSLWEDVIDSFDIDLEYRISWEKLREVRLKKLRDMMDKKDLDALLLTLSYNVRYATDFRPLFGPFYVYDRYAAIVPKKENPILFMTEPEIALGCVAKRMPWIKDVRKMYQFSSSLYAVDLWIGSVKEALEDYGLRGGRIGVDYLSFMVYDKLKENMPGTAFISSFEDLATIRSIKHPEELKVMIEAVYIAEIGMRAAIDSLKDGIKEYEVAAEALKAMAAAGMEVAPFSPSIRAGRNAAIFQRTTTGKRIRSGETVIIDIGATYGGYCADFNRTVVLGKPNDKQKDMYKALIRAHTKAIETISPGVRVSEIDKIIREEIKKAGYPEFPGGTGHGIGMSLGEFPMIPPPNKKMDMELEPGMVFCLEPGIFIPEVAGVKVEDMILVTDKGAEILTKIPYDEKLLG